MVAKDEPWGGGDGKRVKDIPNEITPMAWKMPSLTTNRCQSFRLPLSDEGASTPWTTMVTTITVMLNKANALALAN